jgi:hypothetical protein
MLTGLQHLLLAKPATFSQEDVPDATFDARIGRALRFYVARYGFSVIQRPQFRSGRRCHDYDFYYPNGHACGIVLYSRHSPGHKALSKGWFISDRDFERLQEGLVGGSSYGLILYLFKSGDLFWINANLALASGNHDLLPMVMASGEHRPGIHVHPITFTYMGSLLHPEFGDGEGPLVDGASED